MELVQVIRSQQPYRTAQLFAIALAEKGYTSEIKEVGLNVELISDGKMVLFTR